MKPICASCGTEQRTRAAFCRRCGAALTAGAEAPASAKPGPVSVRTGTRVLWLALGAYAVLLVANLASMLGRVDLAELRVIQLVLAAAALGTFFAAPRWSALRSLGTFASFEGLSLGVVGRIALGVLGALGAAWLLGLVWHTVDAELMALYRAQGQSKLLAFADGSVIAPVLEETVFRGIVLGALVAPLGRSGALWTSSLMFATLHLTPLTVVHHTLLGLTCGYARLKSRGLVVPMGIHAGYNTLVLALAW